MNNAPTNADDVIDSRAVMERIEELEGERDAHNDGEQTNWSEACEDDAAELSALEALRDEAEECGDWRYGETLIRDSYFEEYAQELADDCGMVNAEATWPNNCIDWERAARELQMDYTSVDFAGVTYWVRS